MTFEAMHCETGSETRTFSRCKSFSQQGDSLQHRHWMGCYQTLKGFLSAEEGRCLERQPYWSWLSLSPLSARNIFIFNKVSAESLYENILHECKILHRKCSGCVGFKCIVQQQSATGNVARVVMSWSIFFFFQLNSYVNFESNAVPHWTNQNRLGAEKH